MKLSVPRTSAYNLASETQRRLAEEEEGAQGREGSATRRFTTIAHNVVCSQRDCTEIFIVPLPLRRAGSALPATRSAPLFRRRDASAIFTELLESRTLPSSIQGGKDRAAGTAWPINAKRSARFERRRFSFPERRKGKVVV